LWNLKGEKLRGMRSDFDPVDAKDGAYIFPTTANHADDYLQFGKFGRNKAPRHENLSDILDPYTLWRLTRLAVQVAHQSICSLDLLI
jgi:hypothetical protein